MPAACARAPDSITRVSSRALSGPRRRTSATENRTIPLADWRQKRCAKRATEAREILSPIPAERIGLVLSTTKANIEAWSVWLITGLVRPRPAGICRRIFSRLISPLRTARTARFNVFRVACVSGLVALQQGAKLIQRGAADAVLVVGVDHLSAFVVAGFAALEGD